MDEKSSNFRVFWLAIIIEEASGKVESQRMSIFSVLRNFLLVAQRFRFLSESNFVFVSSPDQILCIFVTSTVRKQNASRRNIQVFQCCELFFRLRLI